MATSHTLVTLFDSISVFRPLNNLLQHDPDFQRPCKRRILKRRWKKGENAGNQHFLFSHNAFYLFFFPQINFNSSILTPANASNFDQSEIVSFGKELTHYHTSPSPDAYPAN